MDSRIYSKKMIENMKNHLNNVSRYITYPKFIFLCGKAASNDMMPETNRGIISKYLNIKSKDLITVFAESFLTDISGMNIDLLSFEDFLAEVSDSIILFVESPGTFCELGAFTYRDKLFNEKLIIVLDKQFKGVQSFIIAGPVAKAKKEGATIIYAPLDGSGLLSCDELRNVIEERINSFNSKRSEINKKSPNIQKDKVLVNTFLYEILELIRLLEPVDRKDLFEIYKLIKGFDSFTFVKSNGDEFKRNLCSDIIKLLECSKLINIANDIIYINEYQKNQSILFNYTLRSQSQERMRLICRKYRYGGV